MLDDSPATPRVREIYTPERYATIEYSPDLDGLADPGEVVWSWVPFEEDPTQGKDRPLLVVGRYRKRLLGMMLSSKGHDDHPDWLPLGAGAWDRNARDSYVRLDRVFALDEDDIRREGSVLDPQSFVRVAAELIRLHGWEPVKAR
ncbi:type II toxin-antitoxin system PemK/MazF family toxin [Stackebrandtia nassauensis]|uniref:PemK family protein n=1 Tax=Stackebrandtia nassauensis (strain DSM 44728 / CIP 108903 / NRRL B-16338 / NBRC 102104 / LLR-40K-21) TaxID=446470 RepID=D3Q588_STANL|nr:type II toxin-antitoxin system PemK/MazF family toxin [Stackebrandtia nassauensis]ADD44137.1 hypothetical protein Snas_4492 [Stackebrandtia nassauensis DSM 44728]